MATSSIETVTSWLPVSAAAELLRVSRSRVYQLIEAGSVTAVRVDRTWLINRRSVDSRIAMLRAEGGDHDGVR